ncbi:MAG: EpsI family protein [Alphaproteobacteria bacterium]|nr:EpsI family protein [Alphaproteobacteria bacterium]
MTSYRMTPKPFLLALALVVAAAAASAVLGDRSETLQPRDKLINFPMRIAEWRGRQSGLEQPIIDVLKLDDYILADFRLDEQTDTVNFYVAYYASQSAGQSAHSPSSCIPGGGWEIQDIRQYPVANVLAPAQPLVVNRVQIAKGNVKQLVYYWFEQRGRRLTSEYRVKWYLFWDGITRGRTDGALIRLVTPIFDGDSISNADRRLSEFVRAVYPRISAHVPS